MTRYVLSTDASVLDDGVVGIAYVIEKIEDDEKLGTVIDKSNRTIDLESDKNNNETVVRAEYAAIIYGSKAAREYVDDSKLTIRCDNRSVVRAVSDGRVPDDTEEDTLIKHVLEDIDWEIRDIPRELNNLADSLSKQASHGIAR